MSLAVCLVLASLPARQTQVGLPELALDTLPAFRQSIRVGSVTSYDRSGGNDDGFSGKYSFVRKEGDSLVLADLQGPGCIYRIHTPTPSNDPLEIYFDGESKPRVSLSFADLFSGKVPPFVRPIVDYAGGGYTSYLPLPFAKSCKVVLRAKTCQFYDLNYAIFPSTMTVATFDPGSATYRKELLSAAELFKPGISTDLSARKMPSGSHAARSTFETRLAAGKAITVFEAKKPGRIASLQLGPSSAFVGKDRDVWLRITWDTDKAPAVLCPVGDFFGYAWGKAAMASRLVGSETGVDYCNLPMPFDHAAKIELVSLRSGGSPLEIHGEVVVGDKARRHDEGKFYAVWNRENPTTPGKAFTYLKTTGRGHVVGLALQAQGTESGNTGFFEGDDVAMIDGELAIHGTGSEDSFNGGWYDVPDRWDGQFSRPLSGCLAYQKQLGRSGGYRFMLGDAYAFHKSIDLTIEHGPDLKGVPADYCSVAYLYSDRNPNVSAAIPSLQARRVVDLNRITFAAHWTTPIMSFSFQDATLSRRSVPAGGHQERCLSLRCGADDFFGPPFLSLGCELPAEGSYDVSIDAVKGPEQGKIQLFQNESPVGDPIDLYSATPGRTNSIRLGKIAATEGMNKLMFKIVGKNDASKSYGFDLVNVICERSR